MTYETRALLRVALSLIGFAAILACAGLLATSCDGSQFPRVGQLVEPDCLNQFYCGFDSRHADQLFPVRIVPSGDPSRQTSLAMRLESGDRSSRRAVGVSDSTAEFMHSWFPVATSEEASPLAECGVSAPSLHGTGSEDKG